MSAIAPDGTVGVYELKAHLSSVLEEVLAGRVVTITRHGHPIASLQPVAVTGRRERLRAVEQMRALREGRLLGMSPRAAVEDGR
jgi:prevent-host-death family protein